MSNTYWVNTSTGQYGDAEDIVIVDLTKLAVKRGISVDEIRSQASMASISEITQIAKAEGTQVVGWRPFGE